MPKYRVGVSIEGQDAPVYNALTFDTREAAAAYGAELAGRWMPVTETWVEVVKLDVADIDRLIAAGGQYTVGETMELLGLDGPGIDTALPQPWVDRARQLTGIYAPGKIVWSYREEHGSTLFGVPVALCGEGQRVIAAMQGAPANY